MKKKIPPLCAAVKRIRELYGDSQEAFGRRVGVALMTISRFETGRVIPRDPRVLLSLAEVAAEKKRTFLEYPDDAIVIGSEFVPYSTTDPKPGDPFWQLCQDEQLFRDAYAAYERIRRIDPGPIKRIGRHAGELESSAPPAFRSVREWRLSCAARLAVLYFPERVAAMEAAAGSAITIIDEVLSQANENQIDYVFFEGEVFRLADRLTLLELKQGRKDQ